MKSYKHNYLIFGILFFIIFSCKDQKIEAPILSPSESLENDVVSIPTYMDLDLKGYQTPDVNLKNMYGEVIFVNFWGSWCPPCRLEMPSIQSLYNDYGDKVKFVMIAFEKERGKHKIFIDEHQYTFPVYEAVSPMESTLKPHGFPTTLIIDKKGNIITREVGYNDWNSKEVRNKLDNLLSQNK